MMISLKKKNCKANLAEGSELGDSGKGDLVIGSDLVVIGGIGEGKWEHTLLLEVGLVDSSEGFDDDSSATKMSIKFIITNQIKCHFYYRGSRAACSREEPSP